MSRLTNSLVLLLLPFLSIGQDVRFYAETNSRSVPVDGYFEVHFKVDNAASDKIVPPDFQGFTVLGGPSYSSQTSIINGSVTRSSSVTYVLQPKSIGIVQIGQATATINGKKYTSQAISIEVTKAESASGLSSMSNKGEEVFVQIEVDQKEPYIGQQVILDYVIYSRISVNSFNFNSESKYTGIYVKPFKNFDAGVKTRTINGYQYRRQIMRRLALFPQQSGNILIEPAVITLGVPMEDDPFGNFFQSSRPKQVRTNSVELQVKSLPQPIPADFAGVVGEFQYSVTCDKSELTTDDAAMLSFKIGGNGDMKAIRPPKMPQNDNIDFYPPEVLEDNEEERSGEFFGNKTYVIDLTPKKAVDIEVKVPDFVYFDPKQKAYKTISLDPLQLSVSPGIEKKSAGDEGPQIVSPQQSFFEKNKTGLLAATGIATLALAAFLLIRKKKNSEVTDKVPEHHTDNLPPEPAEKAVIIPGKADEIPVKDFNRELDMANEFLFSGDQKSFIRQLYNTFSSYLSDRLEIPLSQFNVNKIREVMEEKKLSRELVTKATDTLRVIESAAYGGLTPNLIPDQLLHSVKEIMEEISK